MKLGGLSGLENETITSCRNCSKTKGEGHGIRSDYAIQGG